MCIQAVSGAKRFETAPHCVLEILTLTGVMHNWKIWAYYSQFANDDHLHREIKTHPIHGHPPGTGLLSVAECQLVLSFLTQRLLENVSRVTLYLTSGLPTSLTLRATLLESCSMSALGCPNVSECCGTPALS